MLVFMKKKIIVTNLSNGEIYTKIQTTLISLQFSLFFFSIQQESVYIAILNENDNKQIVKLFGK